MTTSFGLVLPGSFGKALQVDFELLHVERHVEDLEPAHPGGPVVTIAGMPAERLRGGHDHIAWLRQRMIDRHIAQHAAHQAVVRIVAAERDFQQFDTQRFDLIDVLRTREPAVDPARYCLRRRACRSRMKAACAPSGWSAPQAPGD